MSQYTAKRKLLIDSLLAYTFLALIIFAIVYIFTFNKSSEKIEAASTEEISIVKTDDAFVQTIRLQKNTNKGNYIIKYPKTKSSKFNKVVKESINELKKEFLNTHSKSSTLYVDYKFIKHKKLYSFVLTQKVEEGTVLSQKNITTFLVDAQNKDLLTLNEIIPTQKKLLHMIPTIQNNFAKNKSVIEYNATHKKKLKIDERPIHFKNIALSNTTLYFFFGRDNYTMTFDKNIRVAVPLSTIQNFLATDLKEPVKKQPVKKSEKYVALTFDDGPNPSSTKKILATLKKEKIHATFFILGEHAKQYPIIVKQIYKEGHELGNHSYSHPDLAKLSSDAIEKELTSTAKYIQKASGHKPTVFRPPYGSYNPKVTLQNNLPMVLWTVDTLDWQNHNTKDILANINAQKSNQTIILMHDIHMTSADALPHVIKQLKKDNYTFVTSSEMLAIQKNTK